MRRRSVAVNLCLLAVVAVAATPTHGADAFALAEGRRAFLSLTQYLKPEDRQRVADDLYAASKETTKQKDALLREVWMQLFQLGPLLQAYHLALNELTPHLKGFSSGPPEPFVEAEFVQIAGRCAAAEDAIEQYLLNLKKYFNERLSLMAVEQQVDIEALYGKYESLAHFLRALHRAFEMRVGMASLLKEQRLLQESEAHGALQSRERLHELDEQLSALHYRLARQDHHLMEMALQARKAKTLFRAGLSLIHALLAADED
ncbi:hypothetical protein Efla_003966 [Eimeria flavescens]